jgi:hypothetical protein
MAQPATRRLVTEQKAADTYATFAGLNAAVSTAVSTATPTAVLTADQSVSTTAYTDLTGLALTGLTTGLWRVELAGLARQGTASSTWSGLAALVPTGGLVAATSGATVTSSSFARALGTAANVYGPLTGVTLSWTGNQLTAVPIVNNQASPGTFNLDVMLRVTTGGGIKAQAAVGTTPATASLLVGTQLRAVKVGA